jgi:hypothetical protein
MRNQLYRNTGRGLGAEASAKAPRFEEISAAGGPPFARAEISRGAAFGDVDNDGDVDVLVTTNNGPVRLLLNRSQSGNHWLQIALRDESGQRFGLGARVGIERAGQPTLWRRVKTDGSYLSASDIRVHAGLGRATAAGVIVEWPGGARETWKSVAVDRLVTLRRGSAK